MASKLKKGKYGMTRPRIENTIGTVIIRSGQFADIKGEIIGCRNDYMQYLIVQVPSEYKGRVYILNLLYSQCKDIQFNDVGRYEYI